MEVIIGIVAIVGAVMWLWIKSLLGKIDTQKKKLEKVEAEKIVEKAKTEVLKEKIIVEKAIDEKEREHVENIKEASGVEETIGTINDAINDFNGEQL